MLMSVPNVSEGVDQAALSAIGAAFAPPDGVTRLLDIHSDVDHHRSVFTLVSEQGSLAADLAAGAAKAHELIDISGHSGIHPLVGAVDVVPVVYLDPQQRGAACAEALTAAHEIALRTQTPVFLYGELAAGRERAAIRSGGTQGLAERIASGKQKPDFGPHTLDPAKGATLVGARPPMVAFNLQLAAGETLETAKEIASRIREAGGGPKGVRSIGLYLDEIDRAQVSCNIHDPFATPLAEIVGRVRAEAPVESAELVGLAPQKAFDGFPEDLPIGGFDAQRHILENALQNPALFDARRVN